MVEHTTSVEIFVALLDEAVDVWRPVRAQYVAGDAYLIIGESPDPVDERWEFLPGSIVRCREQQLSGGACLVAYEVVSDHASDHRDATPTI